MNICVVSTIGVIRDFIVKYRIVENSLSRKTVDLVSDEMKFTLDQIAEYLPRHCAQNEVCT